VLRKILNRLLGLYLRPLRISERLVYYVRGMFFTNASEHLYRATRHILRHTQISPGDVIVDVGAFDGGTSSYFSRKFPAIKVYSFEPNPCHLPALADLAVRNQHIVVRPMVLGVCRGESMLFRTRDSLSCSLLDPDDAQLRLMPKASADGFDPLKAVPVQVSTLAEELGAASRILLLTLDAQGTELDILQGGFETLRKTKYVLTEMNNHSLYKKICQYYEVDDMLRARGFRLVDIIVTYRGDDGLTEYDALYEKAA